MVLNLYDRLLIFTMIEFTYKTYAKFLWEMYFLQLQECIEQHITKDMINQARKNNTALLYDTMRQVIRKQRPFYTDRELLIGLGRVNPSGVSREIAQLIIDEKRNWSVIENTFQQNGGT